MARMDEPPVQSRETTFNFHGTANQKATSPKSNQKPRVYHSHRAFNIKATLTRNASLSTDLNHVDTIRSGIPVRPKTSERAQTALFSHVYRLGTAKTTKCGKSARKLYRDHLSHAQYGHNTLGWDKVPEWELSRPQDIKFKHMAHRKVQQVWKRRNMPNYSPIPSYDKLVTKALHIKSPKKRKQLKNLKKSKTVQYLKPGPIFKSIRIYSSNTANRSSAHKDEQIFLDIETRTRTHRPKVVLWPSEFYKQRHLNQRGKRKKHKSPKQNMLINRRNKKERIEFQNTFTNSYLFNIERDSDYLYVPKQYDVEVSVCEQAIGSKKWRAVLTVNSHHFQSGIVPFTIGVRQISKNQQISSKQHVTNMTTDNSYVILKCNTRHRKSKKKRKRQKHAKRRAKTKRKAGTSRHSVRIRSTTASKRAPSVRNREEAEESDIDSLLGDFARLKGSINDIRAMLCRAEVLGDADAYHDLKRREQQMVNMIKNRILDIETRK